MKDILVQPYSFRIGKNILAWLCSMRLIPFLSHLYQLRHKVVRFGGQRISCFYFRYAKQYIFNWPEKILVSVTHRYGTGEQLTGVIFFVSKTHRSTRITRYVTHFRNDFACLSKSSATIDCAQQRVVT